MQKAREYYETKNKEIEMLIRQVMQARADPKTDKLNADSVDSLLRYLIYIVLHDESQETANDRVK